MITQLDQATIRMIRDKLETMLPDISKQLGLVVKIGNGSFNANNVTFKLECAVTASNGVTMTKEVSDFKRLAQTFGVSPIALGTKFKAGGKIYKLVGLKPKSWRFPFIAENENGKRFKFPPETVRATLDPAFLTKQTTHLNEQ